MYLNLLSKTITVACIIRIAEGLSINKSPTERRQWFKQSLKGTFITLVAESIDKPSNAAETVGKDPNCNDATCLGIWDGLLADCPHDKNILGKAGCTSSQDDTPGIFSEPWDYSESSSLDYKDQMRLLISAIELASSKRGDTVQIQTQIDRYLRVSFVDKSGESSIGEFYFTPNDTTIQFRVGNVGNKASFKSISNLERCEMIRKEARFLKLPVLRNRKRTLFFGESEYDTFGPGSAALGPPAEMTTGELEGRQDVDPNLKIDFLESFPVRR